MNTKLAAFSLTLRLVLSLAPFASLLRASKVATDVTVGTALRLGFPDDDVIPYLGIQVAAYRLTRDKVAFQPSDSMTDWVLGPMVGGEYFLGRHFSLGVEAQLNVAISDDHSLRFQNPGRTNLSTATGAFAAFYF